MGAATVIEGLDQDEFALLSLSITLRNLRENWIYEYEVNGFFDRHREEIPMNRLFCPCFINDDKKEIAFRFGMGRQLASLGLLKFNLKGFSQLKYSSNISSPNFPTVFSSSDKRLFLGLGLIPELEIQLSDVVSVLTSLDFRIFETGYQKLGIKNPSSPGGQQTRNRIIFDLYGEEAFVRLSLAFKI